MDRVDRACRGLRTGADRLRRASDQRGGDRGPAVRLPALAHAGEVFRRERARRRRGLRLQRRRPPRHLFHQRRQDAGSREGLADLLESPLPQRRPDALHRRHRRGRSGGRGLCNRGGGRRLRQRRPRRSVRRRRAHEPALSQSRRRALRGRHQSRRHRQRRIRRWRRLVRLRQRRPARSARRELRALVARREPVVRRRREAHHHLLPPAHVQGPAESALRQPRRPHLRGRLGAGRPGGAHRQGHERVVCRLRPRRASRHLHHQRCT